MEPPWGIEPQTYALRVNLQISAQEAPAESAGRIHPIGCVSGMMTLQLVDSEPSLPTTATKVVDRARWRRVLPTASSTVRSLLVMRTTDPCASSSGTATPSSPPRFDAVLTAGRPAASEYRTWGVRLGGCCRRSVRRWRWLTAPRPPGTCRRNAAHPTTPHLTTPPPRRPRSAHRSAATPPLRRRRPRRQDRRGRAGRREAPLGHGRTQLNDL